ncbi:hypothetical protein SCP_0307930 [Sparassis crispa]|uniref:DUF6533 domain-containing protein n=1 Tax=Sparassis crispa TaxID=139825 RepID=A0A401GFX9_9APHY|nr:hypothetical protein SCP_0307930 [Sparassis crispa]GBE81069.1 hypothetical protein SCP_0307930 [Sparassis crispa]
MHRGVRCTLGVDAGCRTPPLVLRPHGVFSEGAIEIVHVWFTLVTEYRTQYWIGLVDGLVPSVFPMDLVALWDANATRYLSAIGLVILAYDHVLTFADEVRLVWYVPPSFAKCAFLFNRYLVLCTLLAAAFEMCGFVGNVSSDEGQVDGGAFVFTCSMVAVISVGIANLLVLLRVVILWDHRPIVLKVMSAGFVISFCAQTITMVISLTKIISSIAWSPVARMCITAETTHLLIAVWGSPMLFEAFTLVSTSLNALDRPRAAELPITKALTSDGIGYFLALTCLRTVNVILAAIARPSFTLLGVFLVWGMTTIVLNRSLLHLRRAELEQSSDSVMCTSFPFTLGRIYLGKASAAIPEETWETGGQWVPGAHFHQYHYRKRSDTDARGWLPRETIYPGE